MYKGFRSTNISWYTTSFCNALYILFNWPDEGLKFKSKHVAKLFILHQWNTSRCTDNIVVSVLKYSESSRLKIQPSRRFETSGIFIHWHCATSQNISIAVCKFFNTLNSADFSYSFWESPTFKSANYPCQQGKHLIVYKQTLPCRSLQSIVQFRHSGTLYTDIACFNSDHKRSLITLISQAKCRRERHALYYGTLGPIIIFLVIPLSDTSSPCSSLRVGPSRLLTKTVGMSCDISLIMSATCWSCVSIWIF